MRLTGLVARFSGLVAAGLLLPGLGMSAMAHGLTAEQERGREIYRTGRSIAGGEIGALVSAGADVISAARLPCAGCHGEDGRGRPEGGVRPADITPAVLAREATVFGRTRPAYSRVLLARAIATGRDAGGNALGATMPRYRMGDEDAADLLAYLEVLGMDGQPGVRDDAIHVDILGATDLSNASASIYGRAIVLREGRSGDALLAIDATADGSASVEAAARDGIPTIVVHTGRATPGRNAFVMTATMEDQVAALRAYGQRGALKPRLLIADCRGIGDMPRDALVLMTSEAAARCDLASIPPFLDRRVIVASAAPPGPQGDRALAQAALSIATTLFARIGRDLTRATLLAALERTYRLETPGSPPITWSPSRRFGTRAAWLMTLDLQRQQLLADPGWLEP